MKRLVSKAQSPLKGWYLSTNNDLEFTMQGVNTAVELSRKTAHILKNSLNVWTHIAVSYDGSGLGTGIRIWINGVEEIYTATRSDDLTGDTLINTGEF